MVNLREKASLSKTNIFYEFVLFFVEIPLSLVWFVFFLHETSLSFEIRIYTRVLKMLLVRDKRVVTGKSLTFML